MRRRNIEDVLACVRNNAGISRAELSKTLGLAKATVSDIVDELTGKTVLEEIGVKESSGGRPAVGLQFNPNYGLVLGVSLDESEISGCLMNLDGDTITNFSSRIDHTWNGTKIAEFLSDRLFSALKEENSGIERILAVGIAVPGPVSDGASTDEVSSFLETDKVKKILAIRTRCLPVVESNTNMAALAEIRNSKIKDSELVFVLRIGHKIRSAVMCSGILLNGSGGLSGEFGHLSVPNNKRLCDCGTRGCIDTVASTAAMIKLGQDSGLRVRSIGGLLESAGKDDPVAQAIFAEAGKAIGFGLGQVINLLAPHAVIVAGPAVKNENLIMRSLRNKVRKCAKLENRNNCRIITGSAAGNSECIGAGLLALKKLDISDACLTAERVAVG